jgi:hypothetical protein
MDGRMIRVIQVDLMLLNWSETANGGAKVVFQLADTDDLAHFRSLTLAKGGRSGQLFSAALALVEDEPEAIKRRVGPRCQLAVRWCKDPEFRGWLEREYPEATAAVLRAAPGATSKEEWAAAVVRAVIGVKSRAEIDKSEAAATLFDLRLRAPFMEFLSKHKSLAEQDVGSVTDVETEASWGTSWGT